MAGKDGDNFLDPEECIMIFRGSDAICSKRQQKVCYREAYATSKFMGMASYTPTTFHELLDDEV